MPNQTASILSGFLTLLILIILAISSIFMQMVVLNGVSENQGFNDTVAGLPMRVGAKQEVCSKLAG